MAQSVKALYGASFDAEGYLRRFFDVDFRLPEADRKAFIEATLNAIQIDDYFDRTRDRVGQQDADVVRNLLRGFFSTPALSLRRVAQALHRLGVVFASLRSDRRAFAITTVVALIVRTVDTALYHRFVRGEVSDKEVVDTVFSLPGTTSFRHEYYGNLFEAFIIACAHEEDSSDSLLLSHYQAKAEKSSEGSQDLNQAVRHAKSVIAELDRLLLHTRGVSSSFKCSVERLELLSPDLIEERT